ncbi:hypothetical protein H9P43_001359 [Blastocladiella emersonii ATCC 22665]|nr:hypothetical protein H9P43_001359 [Blastocladiella emersonii ATCC 22665]
MSDTTRQSLSDRAKAAAMPQGMKDDSTIMQEKARGAADTAQAHLEPESEKSYMQKAADSIRDMTEGTDTTGMRSSTGMDTSGMQSGTGTGTSGMQSSSGTTTGATTGANQEGLYEKAKHFVMGDK